MIGREYERDLLPIDAVKHPGAAVVELDEGAPTHDVDETDPPTAVQRFLFPDDTAIATAGRRATVAMQVAGVVIFSVYQCCCRTINRQQSRARFLRNTPTDDCWLRVVVGRGNTK